MRIALVQDYFTQLGGEEKVAEALYDFLPDAQLFATVALKDGTSDAVGLRLRLFGAGPVDALQLGIHLVANRGNQRPGICRGNTLGTTCLSGQGIG